MTIHICHRSHQEPDRTIVEVPRVTVRAALRLPVLIIGTGSNIEQVPLSKIESFWVEED